MKYSQLRLLSSELLLLSHCCRQAQLSRRLKFKKGMR